MALPFAPPLFPEEHTPPPPRRPPVPPAIPHVVTRQLWAAVYFPRLALEALGISPTGAAPVAVWQGKGRNTAILDCTAGAQGHGIRAGQPLGAALALASRLHLYARAPERERKALLGLAEIGYDFTPTISLETPWALLLEIGASAHLFAGPEALGVRARDKFRSAGFTPALAVAPTPLAALWLAQTDHEVVVTEAERLPGILGKLTVGALRWAPGTQDAFRRLGIRCLADLLRLPRDGLARRFGPELLALLDRATGRQADPRSTWQAPQYLRYSQGLPGDFTGTAALLPYLENMLRKLARDLRTRDAAISRLKILFRHWREPSTILTLGSSIPSRDQARWLSLLQLQLPSQSLPAPVCELCLVSGALQPYQAENENLFAERNVPGNPLPALVDLLRARLGHDAVFSLALTPDARPEHAWRIVEPGEDGSMSNHTPVRPLVLLARPVPLAGHGGTLHYRTSRLKLLPDAERIAGGWWEGETWTRDYYQALSDRGERLWIFRQDHQWFLHGMFS